MSESDLTRINKYLSEVGYCSRRAADKLIEQGRVTINGLVPEMGTKVAPNDEVCVDGKSVTEKEKPRIYIAFNKPVGIVCTTDTRVEPDNIIDFINYPERIFPIGRLDKPSEGLIFLTDDGDIVNKILRDRNNHEKEYIVSVNKPVTSDFIQKMSSGVPILGAINIVKETVGNEVITEGLSVVHDSVKEGESIVKPLRSVSVFDPIVINMIEVGEETGKLDEMLIRVADTYENEIDVMISGITSLLEPVLIMSLAA